MWRNFRTDASYRGVAGGGSPDLGLVSSRTLRVGPDMNCGHSCMVVVKPDQVRGNSNSVWVYSNVVRIYSDMVQINARTVRIHSCTVPVHARTMWVWPRKAAKGADLGWRAADKVKIRAKSLQVLQSSSLHVEIISA